jgi:hypothetical protein
MRVKINKNLGIKEKIRESILGSSSVLGGRCCQLYFEKNLPHKQNAVYLAYLPICIFCKQNDTFARNRKSA